MLQIYLFFSLFICYCFRIIYLLSWDSYYIHAPFYSAFVTPHSLFSLVPMNKYFPNKQGFVKSILRAFYSYLLQDKDSSRMYLQAASSEQSLVSRFWSNASTWSSFNCPTHFGSSVNPVSTRCSSIIDSASSTTLQPILAYLLRPEFY